MPKCVQCGKFRKEKDFIEGNKVCRFCSRTLTKTPKMKYGKFIQDLKTECGCFFCKESDPVALDYHHVYPHSKQFSLGAIRGQSAPEIHREIDKCIVLCSNCHRKLHAGHKVIPKKILDEYKRYATPPRNQR